MKEIDFDPHDDRPFVKDLLNKYRKEIVDVREKILSDETIGKPFFDPERYDDLWILRYLLSHNGKVKNSTKAALKTIKFREEHKLNELGEIGHRLMNCFGAGQEGNDGNGGPRSKEEKMPHYDVINSCFSKDSLTLTQPDPNRGILCYIDFGGLDTTKYANIVTKDQMMESRMYTNEAVYRILDDITRRTGRLTKQCNLIDCKNFKFLQLDRKFTKVDGEVSKEFEDYYPQMVSTMFFFNVPGWAMAIWITFKRMLFQKIKDKIDIAPYSATQTYYEPFLKHVSEANLPERFGGNNRTWPLPSVSVQLAAAASS